MAFLRDGFSTLFAFATIAITPPVQVVEKTVTAPGIEGGGGINITNMRNERFRTAVPKSLLTVKNLTLTVQHDPVWYNLASANFQVVDVATLIFPDLSNIEFYAWIDDISPQEHREGEEPLANMVVIPSMFFDGLEVPIVYNPPT